MPSKCSILLFHGVADLKNDEIPSPITNYNNKHISKEIFEEYISYISKYKNVISMNDFVDIHFSKKQVVDNSCIVTFDDGFKNNYLNAAPILEKYKCPAIFYVSTKIVGSNNLFWVDQLEIGFTETKRSFFQLNKIFELNEKYQEFFTIEFKYIYNNKFDLKYNKVKIYLLDQLKRYLKQLDRNTRNHIIKKVLDYLIDSNFEDLKLWNEYNPMSWEDIKNLSKNKLFEIGGHSSNHDILSKLPKLDLKKDIKDSINKIKSEIGYFSGHYAYPEGQKEHYDNRVINILKKEGVICCPSAIHGESDFKEDLFHLKRIMVDFNNQNSISNLLT